MAKEKDLSKNLGDMMAKAKETLEKSNSTGGGADSEDLYGDLRRQIGEDEAPATAPEKASYDDQQYTYDYNYTDDDYNIQEGVESAYKDGPTKAQIEIWKKQYGENSVFHVRVVMKDFVFRPLNRLEYKTILAQPNTDATLREEIICKTCVLYPPYNFDAMAAGEAGYPSSLSQIIMDNSGFSNDYDIEVL